MGSPHQDAGQGSITVGLSPPFLAPQVVLSLSESKICFKHLLKLSWPLQNTPLQAQGAGRTPGAGAGDLLGCLVLLGCPQRVPLLVTQIP